MTENYWHGKQKHNMEFTDEVKREIMKADLKKLTYLPKLPSTADIQVCADRLRNNLPLTTTSTSTASSLMTLDATCLNLACSTDTDPRSWQITLVRIDS